MRLTVNADDVLRRVAQLERGLRIMVADEFHDAGRDEVRQLRTQTGHEFQEVPSYLVESKMGLPGRKLYPPDTPATFATTSASIAGTPWHRQVQQYIDSESQSHPVQDLLTSAVTAQPDGQVIVEVGYPPGAETQHRFLGWILFGTEKMQARPFLQLALVFDADRFRTALRKGIARAIALARG